jgi:hypothetical protein
MLGYEDDRVAAAPAHRLVIAGSQTGRQPLQIRVRLSETPRERDRPINPLVVGGTLAVSLSVDAGDAAEASGFYARNARFSLDVFEVEVGSANARGEAPAASLMVDLNARQAIEVVRALAGRNSRVTARASLQFESEIEGAPVELARPLCELVREGAGADGIDALAVLMAPDPATGAWRELPRPLDRADKREVTPLRMGVWPTTRGLGNAAAAVAVSRIQHASASALLVEATAATWKPNKLNTTQIPSVSVQPATRPHFDVATAKTWVLDPLVLPPTDIPWRGPLIIDQDAAQWSDAVNASKHWYVPQYDIVRPNPSVPALGAPFRFFVEQTGHDIHGQPSLSATITFTLVRGMSAATKAELMSLGNPQASPVEPTSLAVSLSVPFRDEHGQLQRQLFPTQVATNGDLITATVSLLDDWARLTYGALAMEGFQSEPARIRVDIAFEARVMPVMHTMPYVVPGKVEKLPDIQPAPIPTINAFTIRTRTGTIHLESEAEHLTSLSRAAPLTTATLVTAVRPDLVGRVVSEKLQERLLPVRTVGRTLEQDCLFPCNTLGAFYIQATPYGQEAIGCRDALTLAQTQFRQYEAVADPRIPSAIRLFRSLQQPGHFLVVPQAYKITRFDATEGDRAYRPAALLYSALDANEPKNNRCVLIMTLGPDFPAHDDEFIRDLARQWAPSPVIEYLTEIPTDTTFVWSLAAADIIRSKQVIRRWDGFEMTIEVDVEQAPLLQSMLKTGGISVVARFTLPDSTVLETTLRPDISDIIGPPITGPVSIERAGSGARLTNRIDRTVDVDALLTIADNVGPGVSRISRHPVGRTLRFQQSVDVSVPAVSSARQLAAALPHAGEAGSLTEIRSFVEDIFARVMFINLIKYQNHQLDSITLNARIKNVVGQSAITTSEMDPVATVEFVLPLTVYVDHPVLQFQATMRKKDASVQQTPWLDWPLVENGNVVSLTWSLLTGSPA